MRTKYFVWFVILALLLVLPSVAIASGHIARGAVPGELYVYGIGDTFPEWEDWLYRSTDGGQTVYLQNDTVEVDLLGESVDTGELYKACRDGGRLSYSDDFGVDFVLKTLIGPALKAIASGYIPGEIYACIDSIKYSSDYGETFWDRGVTPGPVNCMSVGHNPGEIYCGCDNRKIYHSIDYGETFECIVALPKVIWQLSRGCADGEIYFFASDNMLYYSPNRGDSLYQQHYFDINPDYLTGIAGGFLSGEIYVLESRHYFLGGGDLYIHRSTDYGQSFTVYHVHSGRDDTVPPKSIDDLTCATCDSSLFLDWSPISKDIWNRTEQVDYYVVYRHQDPDFEPSSADSIGSSTTPSYLDSGARWTTQGLYYVVNAVDDSGNKSGSSNRVGKINKALVNE